MYQPMKLLCCLCNTNYYTTPSRSPHNALHSPSTHEMLSEPYIDCSPIPPQGFHCLQDRRCDQKLGPTGKGHHILYCGLTGQCPSRTTHSSTTCGPWAVWAGCVAGCSLNAEAHKPYSCNKHPYSSSPVTVVHTCTPYRWVQGFRPRLWV